MYNQDESGTAFGITTYTYTNGGRGWLGRFGGGCDYQFGGTNWVVGVLGDYDTMNLKDLEQSANFTAGGGGGPPAGAFEKENSAWYVGGRLGYLITPNLLSFVSGGYTETRFGQRDFFNLATGASFGTSILAHNYHGGFFGSGVEYNLNLPWLPINGLFWRTEYRYSDYRTDDLPVITTATGVANGSIIHDHKYVQTVTSSLVWRFNWTGTPVMAKY